MRYRAKTRLIVAIASALSASSASAGSCAAEIADFRRLLQQQELNDSGDVGTAKQSIGAQLERQPTPNSVESAEKRAKSEILSVLAQAQTYDAGGKQIECKAALDKARLLLNP